MGENKRISSEELVGAKEILKSMPDFYKKVYFPSLYIEEISKHDYKLHESILVLAKRRDLNYLRGYLQKMFIYREDLDSLNYKEEDYGFSFIINNIKFVVGAIVNKEEKIIIKMFDTNEKEGIIYDYSNPTDLLDSFTSEVEERIKICNLDMEDFNKNSYRDKPVVQEMVVENTAGKISTAVLIGLIIVAVVINVLIYIVLH